MTAKDERRDVRTRAYAAGARIAREAIARDVPADAEALAQVEASDIVVVPGSYDRVEMVLAALEMPHTIVEARHLSSMRLRPDQLLVVNCPGHLDGRDLRGIRSFVEEGGSLFTTDWALKHVIEPLFPGTVFYNQCPTRDDVVRIEIRDHDNPFLRGVMDGADDPQWWLEGSSYPIGIRDPERVHVLISSPELAERYGEAPVAVLIRHGRGEVFHMISHYYLQRTELRTKRHQANAVAYASEKFEVVAPAMAASMEGLRLGEVESAASSARLFANVVAAKKRRARR
jgi:hypothetical protein